MKTWKILFIVIIISAVGFGVFPLKKKVAELKKENAQLFQTKQQKIAELKEFTGENAGDTTKIKDPELAIPPQLEQTELLIDLQKIASQTDIQLPDSWSFAVAKDADLDLSEIKVSFSIAGSRGSIYKFLQLVEQNDRFLKVENLGIKSSLADGVPVSEMPITLTAYAQEKVAK